MEQPRTTIVRGLAVAEHTNLRVLAAKADLSLNKLLLAMIRDLLAREGLEKTEVVDDFSPAFKRILKGIDG